MVGASKRVFLIYNLGALRQCSVVFLIKDRMAQHNNVGAPMTCLKMYTPSW